MTGLILAKLDGSAKGGIVVGIRDQLDIPVKFVGLGETLDDLDVVTARRPKIRAQVGNGASA